MKNHEWVDGQLLQTNKRYADLKQKQKAKISQWMYDIYEAKYRQLNRHPDEREHEEMMDRLYNRIQSAGIWVPYHEVEKHFRKRWKNQRAHLNKQLAKERARMNIIKPKYTTLIVENLDRSVAFYRDVLGFIEGYHVDLGEGGRITIMDSIGGASVELIESSKFPVGMYSIGTDVQRLDEKLEELKEKGVEIVLGSVETTVGVQAFIKDPDGVNICLIQHK